MTPRQPGTGSARSTSLSHGRIVGSDGMVRSGSRVAVFPTHLCLLTDAGGVPDAVLADRSEQGPDEATVSAAADHECVGATAGPYKDRRRLGLYHP